MAAIVVTIVVITIVAAYSGCGHSDSGSGSGCGSLGCGDDGSDSRGEGKGLDFQMVGYRAFMAAENFSAFSDHPVHTVLPQPKSLPILL